MYIKLFMQYPWQRSFKLTICKATGMPKAQVRSCSFTQSFIIVPGKYVQTEASLSSWKSPTVQFLKCLGCYFLHSLLCF